MERIALTFSGRDNNDDNDLIAVAQAADRLGYDSFWTGESWGRDAFTVLTMLACNTDRIKLGTGDRNGVQPNARVDCPEHRLTGLHQRRTGDPGSGYQRTYRD